MNLDRALILAAGRGSRLSELTAERPKCLLPFLGHPLLDWQIDALKRAEIRDIHLVRGYHGDLLEGFDATLWDNPDWSSTNMVHSLLCARPLLRENKPLLVAYGDIVYEPRVLQELIGARGSIVVAVNRNWRRLWQARMANPLDDVETLKVSQNGDLVDIGRKATNLDEIDGQYMGMIALSPDGLASLIDFYDTSADSEAWMMGRSKRTCHMTDLLRGLIQAGTTVKSAPVDGGWLEFDTVEDVRCYEHLARNGEIVPFFNSTALGIKVSM